MFHLIHSLYGFFGIFRRSMLSCPDTTGFIILNLLWHSSARHKTFHPVPRTTYRCRDSTAYSHFWSHAEKIQAWIHSKTNLHYTQCPVKNGPPRHRAI